MKDTEMIPSYMIGLKVLSLSLCLFNPQFCSSILHRVFHALVLDRRAKCFSEALKKWSHDALN